MTVEFLSNQNRNRPSKVETQEGRNARFARGEISEDEIQAYWKDPSKPLFEFQTGKGEQRQEKKFRLRGLTEDAKIPLIESTKSAWDEVSLEELKDTLERYFDQKRSERPSFVNIEYYIVEDAEGKPVAMTGIYTLDIEGTAGFELGKKLDRSKHNLVTGLGWFSVSKDQQGSGIGGFLLDWTENMARARGANLMVISADEYENSKKARTLYEKRGYEFGADIKDYFGPGRDLINYYANVSDTKMEGSEINERVNYSNKSEIIDLASRQFSHERLEEFQVCLDMILEQGDDGDPIIKIDSLVLRDSEGGVQSFAIGYKGVYENVIVFPWLVWSQKEAEALACQRLLEAAKNLVNEKGKEVILITQEGTSENFLKQGFLSGNEGVPGVFEEDDDTKAFLYSKRLNK